MDSFTQDFEKIGSSWPSLHLFPNKVQSWAENWKHTPSRTRNHPCVFTFIGNPTWEKIKTLVSYLLVGMCMYTFCSFADGVTPQKLSASQEDELLVYDYCASLWGREDVNTTIALTADQVLLMHCMDVNNCYGKEMYIKWYASSTMHPTSNSVCSQKCQSLIMQGSIVKVLRLAGQSSMCCFSMLPPSSSPSSALMTVFHLRWKLKTLTHSGEMATPWSLKTLAHGLAQDMAWAFGAIGTHPDDIQAWFEHIFHLTPFVKATWYKQLQTWKHLSQAEHNSESQLLQTSEGLWTCQCASSLGWADVHR